MIVIVIASEALNETRNCHRSSASSVTSEQAVALAPALHMYPPRIDTQTDGFVRRDGVARKSRTACTRPRPPPPIVTRASDQPELLPSRPPLPSKPLRHASNFVRSDGKVLHRCDELVVERRRMAREVPPRRTMSSVSELPFWRPPPPPVPQ